MRLLLVLAVVPLFAACGAAPAPAFDGGASIDAGAERDAGASWVLVSGVDAGHHGIFDAAPVVVDDGLAYMSYSTVDDSTRYPDVAAIGTHIARSTDQGLTWHEVGLVNGAEFQPIDVPGVPVDGGVWNQEVSRLRFDPYAANESERWVLVWHRYLSLPAPVPRAEQRRFEHGWLALKTAATPEGPWSAERKWVTAPTYLTADDAIGGPAELRLTDVSPTLADCAALTEPSPLMRATSWVLAAQCAGAHQRIVFLERSRATGQWRSLGSVLDGHAAPELVEMHDGRVYLLATPTLGELYRGCVAYEVTSFDPLTLAATPALTLGLGESDLGFAGACAAAEGLATGVLQSVMFAHDPMFRLSATHQVLR